MIGQAVRGGKIIIIPVSDDLAGGAFTAEVPLLANGPALFDLDEADG